MNYSLERNKNIICEKKSFYILIALLIVVSIYCYLIKYKAKQKHLLSFYITNNELNKICIYNIIEMQSKDKLKEIDGKNRLCYNFDNIIRASDRDIDIDLLVFY